MGRKSNTQSYLTGCSTPYTKATLIQAPLCKMKWSPTQDGQNENTQHKR
jgi:hypothetical protein